MGCNLVERVFSGLVPIEKVRSALVELTSPKQASEFMKKLEAARKYDSDTQERRNYWGELAVWSERRMGTLLIEAKANGTIGHAHSNQKKTSNSTLELLLGTKTEQQAKHISSRAQKLAAPSDEEVAEAIETIKQSGDEVSKAAVQRALVGTHVSNNSGEIEWYTPREYIELARKVMGSIDIDPASSKAANKTVKATKYYTMTTDGLKKEWHGNVWMNPPYENGLVSTFVTNLAGEIGNGNITQAVVLVNNATDTKWFVEFAASMTMLCLKTGRIAFVNEGGEAIKGALQGQVFGYYGKRQKSFASAFADVGICVEVVQ